MKLLTALFGYFYILDIVPISGVSWRKHGSIRRLTSFPWSVFIRHRKKPDSRAQTYDGRNNKNVPSRQYS